MNELRKQTGSAILVTQTADLLEKFLREKKLDGENIPHSGSKQKELAEFTIPLAAK